MDLRWPRARAELVFPFRVLPAWRRAPPGTAAVRGLQSGCQALLEWVCAQVGDGKHGWQQLHCLSVALPVVRLVFLDPQCPPNHAGPTTHGKGGGHH